MAFEIKSCQIVSFERHAKLTDQVRANVRVSLLENHGSHVLNLKLRVLVDVGAEDEVIHQTVLAATARVIGRTISAISGDFAAAAE